MTTPFSMPPQAAWIQGRTQIRNFLRDVPLRHEWRHIPVQSAGQLAIACYILDGNAWRAHSLDVLTLRGQQIDRITAFIRPALFPQFGLPLTSMGTATGGGPFCVRVGRGPKARGLDDSCGFEPGGQVSGRTADVTA